MSTVVEKEFVVTNKESARHVGSGDLDVLSTPSMIAFMEHTAMLVAKRRLEDGQTTVGIEINAKHSAATPIGRTVFVKATLQEQRKTILIYDIEVYDGEKLVGTAEHKRAIVESKPFMEKMAKNT